MNFSRIVINGFLIFIGIALFFLLMEILGLKDQIYLRLFNFVFVIYGVNKTIRSNYKDGIFGYFTNLVSGISTAVVSLVVSLISFTMYVQYKGGEAYLQTFKDSYIFGGGNPSIYQFDGGLLLEGLASSFIVTFAIMQYWKDKVEKINQVDDTNHNNAESRS